MADIDERTGTVSSGDVTLFYRAFGKPGRTPILLMHGTNYYDSTDWVEVARALAVDREVAAYDKRGFGRSGWSPSKDYSVDAHMGDISLVLGTLGWSASAVKPAIMGHSSSGRLGVTFAANHPDQLSRLIVGDSGFVRDEDGGARQATGNPPLMFKSVEDAMAHFARIANPPRMAKDPVRAADGLTKVGDGYVLRRDPDHGNREAIGEGAGLPRRAAGTVWDDLAGVACPTLIIRGLRSDRYPPEIIARIQKARPDFAWATVDSQHDIAYQARDAVVAEVRKFIGSA